MTHPRWFVTIALATALVAAPSAHADEPPAASPAGQTPVGFWESTETSAGGIGAALELRADGTLRHGAVVLVETGYRLEPGRPVSLVLVDESGAEKAIPITLDGDTMTMTGPDGSTLEKTRTRTPSDASSPILGDWSYPHYTGPTAYERYTEDGTMLFRLPIKVETGTYRIDGDRLRVSVAREKAKWTWRLEGEELVVGPKGDTHRYRRVEDGAWYLPAE